MEINIENIMASDYIRLFKLPNCSGTFYFSVTTDRHWNAIGQAIGLRGYEILGRAYEDNRTIYRSDHDDGAICYSIYKK